MAGPDLFERATKIMQEKGHDRFCLRMPTTLAYGLETDSSIKDNGKKWAVPLCHECYDIVQASDDYEHKLDSAIWYLDFSFYRDSETVTRAVDLLSRMPSTPPPFSDERTSKAINRMSSRHFCSPDAPKTFENLKIAVQTHDQTLRLALLVAYGNKYHQNWSSSNSDDILKFINVVSLLMQAATELQAKHDDENWIIVRVLAWTLWHRCTMLSRWHVMDVILRDGHFQGQNLYATSNARHDADSLPGMHGQRQRDDIEVPRYMCKWAFRLLRSDPTRSCPDFRGLFTLFQEAFPTDIARCIATSADQCDGLSADDCQRFVGSDTADQSLHDETCDRSSCERQRLHWDEASYKSVKGARAVLVDSGPAYDDGALKYCSFSEDTMAISHVWAHGQGGRPEPDESGLNGCLHRRYCRIARNSGCSSYWMDTPCIPTEDTLRKEAISHINSIFHGSRLILICDRDLMSLKINATAGQDDVGDFERLIAVLLVCDWNVRAWTLLESVRGRESIHILCKNDVVIRLWDALSAVRSRGRVDLISLATHCQHFLPWREGAPPTIYGEATQLVDARSFTTFDVPTATLMLCSRCASRPGDDFIIWSLLTNQKPFFGAEKLWLSMAERNGSVATGFLMSDLPRFADKHLSWAPTHPRYARSVFSFSVGKPLGRVNSSYGKIFGGRGSRKGSIRQDGSLDASWHAYEFGTGSLNACTGLQVVLRDVVAKHRLSGGQAILIHPMHDYFAEYKYSPYRSDDGELLVAVLFEDGPGTWKWKGLYQWPNATTFPKMTEQDLIII